MEFYVVYLSILICLYAQIFRKEQNFEVLKNSNLFNLILFILYNLVALIGSYFLTKTSEFVYPPPNYINIGIIYFIFAFTVCICCRRKDEKLFDPLILNSIWNLIGAIGIIQYAVIISLLHSVPKK